LTLSLSALLACTLAQSTDTVDVTTQGKAFAVDYVGNSGQMKLKPVGSGSKDTRWIKIRIMGLEEYSQTGNQWTATVNSADTQNKDFVWSTPVDTSDSIEVDFNQNLTVQGTFKAKTKLFKKTTTVTTTDANGTAVQTEVEQDQLKFGYEIDSWPFLQDTNILRLTFEISTGGSSGQSKDATTTDQEKGKNKKLSFVDFGNLQFETQALVDNQFKGVTVDIQNNPSAKCFVATVDFPYFPNTLVYDPIMSGAATSLVPQAVLSLVTALIAALLLDSR